jgi:hypothetical protein
MPCDFRRTCGDLLVCFFHFAREAMGAAGTRHSLRPLFILGRRFLAKLGCIVPRECGVVFFPSLRAHSARREGWGALQRTRWRYDSPRETPPDLESELRSPRTPQRARARRGRGEEFALSAVIARAIIRDLTCGGSGSISAFDRPVPSLL